MRYVGPVGGPPILPDMRYPQMANACLFGDVSAGDRQLAIGFATTPGEDRDAVG